MKKTLYLIIILFLFSILVYSEDPDPSQIVTPSDGFFQGIFDWFQGIWDALICSLLKILRWFISLVENIFFYMIDLVSGSLLVIIIFVFELVPAFSLDFSAFQPYYISCNYFFPLTETIAIIGSVITFDISYTVIKWLIKVTPFIGGG